MTTLGASGGEWWSRALLKRELFSSLRSVRSYSYLLLFLGMTLAYFIYVYPDDNVSMKEAEAMSTQLVWKLAVFLYASCYMFVPGLSGAAIANEKEIRTYDLLYLSLVSPLNTFISKTLNAAGLYLLLVAAVVPVLSTTLFLVGVDYIQITTLFGQIVLFALSSAAIGVMCSALFDKTQFAIVASYVAVASIQLMGQGMTYMVAKIVSQIFIKSTGLPGSIESVFILSTMLVYSMLVLAACAAITVSNLKQPPSKPMKAKPKPKAQPIGFKRAWHARAANNFIERFRRRESVEDRLNPVFVKELKFGIQGRPMEVNLILVYAAFVIVFSSAVGYLLPALMRVPDYTEANKVIGTVVLIHSILAVLMAPSFVANSLAKETEIGNIQMLSMTTLRPAQIVSGKFFFGLVLMTPVIVTSLLIVPPLAFLSFPSLDGIGSLLAGYITFFQSLLFAFALSLLASAVAKKTVAAVFLSYVLCAYFFGVMPLLVFIGREVHLYNVGTDIISMLSPLAMLYYNIDQGDSSLFTAHWFLTTVGYSFALMFFAWLVVFLFAKARMRQR